MQIVLLHNHFDSEHLEAVTSEMRELGAPEIRAIWSEVYGIWMAVEGCHRLRAAKGLGLTPIIVDVGQSETVMIQIDGCDEEINTFDLTVELQDNAPSTTILEF